MSINPFAIPEPPADDMDLFGDDDNVQPAPTAAAYVTVQLVLVPSLGFENKFRR